MSQKTLAESSKSGKSSNSKAHEMAKKQRSISVAEFFEKNRHLLGFDNKRKALLTTIKEAVDNSLDACEEGEVLPEISVEIIDMQNDRFRIIVEDNGPGIVKKQIPKIFAKLLYGSKFHTMKQSRGQQGIGISAAALYGQLTTGRPIRITSKIHANEPANYYELFIDTKTNEPKITKEDQVHWSSEHGTRIELDMEAAYQKGLLSVDAYLKQTAIVNPHCTIIYTDPKANQIIFPRATEKLPKEPKEIKPHPYGVELGMFIKMLEDTASRSLQSFLSTEFSRVSANVAKEICEKAKILPNVKPSEVNRDMAERLVKAIQKTKIMAPPTDCITPIGSENLEKGLKKEIKAEFYCATTRPPSVYRGNPFIIECCTGDSKLTLEDGSEVMIKKYVESKDSRRVMALNEEFKIHPCKVIAKQKFKNKHKLLKIKTKTGRELILTANNEVPLICDGQLIWRKTRDVSNGDFLAVPRKIDIVGRVPLVLDILDKNHVQVLNRKLIKDLTTELILKYDDLKTTALKTGLSYQRLKSFRKTTCICRPYLIELEKIVLDLNKDFDEIKKQITEIRYVDNRYFNPNKILVPDVNEDLLYILGLLESDGYIGKSSIAFVNTDDKLHRVFGNKVKEMFGVNVKKYNLNSYFCNKTIFNIFESLRKHLLTLPTHLIIAWLKGFVDGDGWVHVKKREIGIATAKKEKAQLLQTLLLRLGIVSTIQKQNIPKNSGFIENRRIITRKPQFNIIISSYENVKKFKDYISFRQEKRYKKICDLYFPETGQRDYKDVVPVGSLLKSFREENGLFQHQLGFSDTNVRQMEKGRQNISRGNLQQIVVQHKYEGSAFLNLIKLAYSDILCDKIVDIQLMPHEEYVYDLTTDDGNFVANNIIMHNCAIAYGGELEADKHVRIMRFANRVPLQHQQGACASTESIMETAWKSYGLQQSRKSIPVGPAVILIHMSSVWVPFTSEAKEALAHYPEIIKEMKLALQECGRKLSQYTSKKKRMKDEMKKRSYIEKYIPHVADALMKILNLKESDEKDVESKLKNLLEKKRGKLKDISADNTEYDEDFANIGKEDEPGEGEE